MVVRGEGANVRLEFGEEIWAWLWFLGRDDEPPYGHAEQMRILSETCRKIIFCAAIPERGSLSASALS